MMTSYRMANKDWKDLNLCISGDEGYWDDHEARVLHLFNMKGKWLW